MIRIALAGLGVHGARYAAHLLRGDVAGARLVAVSRRDAAAGRAFAAEHGLRFAADPLELATLPDVDAVAAVLPADLHPALALACVRAGRPVLVEKPLAADARSALAVRDEVERRGAALMVAQTLRFDPLVRRMREESLRLGEVHLISINQRFEPFHRDWIDDPSSGGVLLNTGVHGFDLWRFLSGLEPVTLLAETGRALTERTEDQFVAIARLEPAGPLAVLDNCRTTRGRSGRIEIAGERGQLVGDHVHRTLHLLEGRQSIDLGRVEPVPTVRAALEHFVEQLRSARPFAVTAADGAAAVAMVEAARLSSREGRRVSLREIT